MNNDDLTRRVAGLLALRSRLDTIRREALEARFRETALAGAWSEASDSPAMPALPPHARDDTSEATE